MNKINYYIRLMCSLLLITAGVWFVTGLTAHAAPINTDVNKFANLSGDAAYIQYADNYYIDVEETDMLEFGADIWNNIANMLFSVVVWLGKMTATLFYYCIDFNLAELFDDQINGIQRTLNSGVFEPLFIIAFCGAAVHMVKNLIKRDLMGAYGQVVKVIGILILSFIVVRDSSTAIAAATNVTKQASTQILISMQGDGATANMEDYAAQAAGVLWVNMVHQPWLYVEFWNDGYSGADVYNLLCDWRPGSDDRIDFVESHADGAFSKDLQAAKIAFIVILIIPTAIKSVIYIVMGILTLVYQLLAIFYVVLAPLILLLVMLPGYEGLLSAWLKKLLETQVGILILSFIMGLLVMVDEMLFAQCSDTWGWYIVLVVQAALEVFVILKRDELLGMIGKLQKSATNPGYAKAMMSQGVDSVKISQNMAERGIQMSALVGGAVLGKGAMAAAAAGRAMTAVGSATFSRSAAVGESGESGETEDAVTEKHGARTSGKVERPVLASGGAGSNTVNDSQARNERVTAGRNVSRLPVQERVSVQDAEEQEAVAIPRPRLDNVIYVEPVGKLQRIEPVEYQTEEENGFDYNLQGDLQGDMPGDTQDDTGTTAPVTATGNPVQQPKATQRSRENPVHTESPKQEQIREHREHINAQRYEQMGERIAGYAAESPSEPHTEPERPRLDNRAYEGENAFRGANTVEEERFVTDTWIPEAQNSYQSAPERYVKEPEAGTSIPAPQKPTLQNQPAESKSETQTAPKAAARREESKGTAKATRTVQTHRHPHDSARSRQIDAQKARQQIPVERPRYREQ